ncbi:DinB family protein [Dyadobacter arcticus]|uniref:Damage-inducible protein DinB n=1 Tax=Dyadobacter arcticus TaxID=1078754 RepID=A0ABX0UKZ4_9BACT|nr:DinB family protein [Dyadobacter arcticus]NIJ53674.1 putative damage-inducible protein DinB [Dyadobacter arcticus]
MKNIEKPEVWLRGPLAGVPALLQPVAHSLLQAQEEISLFQDRFPTRLLWAKPSGVASVGFHLQHLAGVLDRLFTYARGESLSETQLAYLKTEEKEPFHGCSYRNLLNLLTQEIQRAIMQLKQTDESTLTEIRYVGRAMVPSTHLGLLFHAAEHTQRHAGQLLVTAKILLSEIQ